MSYVLKTREEELSLFYFFVFVVFAISFILTLVSVSGVVILLKSGKPLTHRLLKRFLTIGQFSSVAAFFTSMLLVLNFPISILFLITLVLPYFISKFQ